MSTASDTTRRIWLLLLSKGGWWAPREVDMELRLEAGTAQKHLQKMKNRDTGLLVHRMVSTKPLRGEFAVMPNCRPPAGLTIGEISRALQPAAGARSAPAQYTPAIDTSNWLSPAELDLTSRGISASTRPATS